MVDIVWQRVQYSPHTKRCGSQRCSCVRDDVRVGGQEGMAEPQQYSVKCMRDDLSGAHAFHRCCLWISFNLGVIAGMLGGRLRMRGWWLFAGKEVPVSMRSSLKTSRTPHTQDVPSLGYPRKPLSPMAYCLRPLGTRCTLALLLHP